ncbi:MAG: hypothetical protein CMH56_00055 [Myxococcales bacterium]|nr:hypothetical protein [Myxococcales bacterium]
MVVLGCQGEPTVQSNQTSPRDETPEPPAVMIDAGQEDNFDFNEAWSTLIGDGGPLEGLYVDGGVLSCLPEEWPEADNPILAILDFASLEMYSGSAEEGVVCDGTTCVPGTPCCVFCGVGFCGEPGENGGMGSCPITTRSIGCDDDDDCSAALGGDTCCMTLRGTDCRAEENCNFSFDFGGEGDGGSASFGGFSAGGLDGGVFTMPDAGSVAASNLVDAGVPVGPTPDPMDAGVVMSPEDPMDAGTSSGVVSHDAGTAPPTSSVTDGGLAGDLLDGGMSMETEQGFWDTQGFSVCTRSFDCELFDGEVCCTSERFTAVDIGVCLPIWLCLGNSLIDGFGDEDDDD